MNLSFWSFEATVLSGLYFCSAPANTALEKVQRTRSAEEWERERGTESTSVFRMYAKAENVINYHLAAYRSLNLRSKLLTWPRPRQTVSQISVKRGKISTVSNYNIQSAFFIIHIFSTFSLSTYPYPRSTFYPPQYLSGSGGDIARPRIVRISLSVFFQVIAPANTERISFTRSTGSVGFPSANKSKGCTAPHFIHTTQLSLQLSGQGCRTGSASVPSGCDREWER